MEPVPEDDVLQDLSALPPHEGQEEACGSATDDHVSLSVEGGEDDLAGWPEDPREEGAGNAGGGQQEFSPMSSTKVSIDDPDKAIQPDIHVFQHSVIERPRLKPHIDIENFDVKPGRIFSVYDPQREAYSLRDANIERAANILQLYPDVRGYGWEWLCEEFLLHEPPHHKLLGPFLYLDLRTNTQVSEHPQLLHWQRLIRDLRRLENDIGAGDIHPYVLLDYACRVLRIDVLRDSRMLAIVKTALISQLPQHWAQISLNGETVYLHAPSGYQTKAHPGDTEIREAYAKFRAARAIQCCVRRFQARVLAERKRSDEEKRKLEPGKYLFRQLRQKWKNMESKEKVTFIQKQLMLGDNDGVDTNKEKDFKEWLERSSVSELLREPFDKTLPDSVQRSTVLANFGEHYCEYTRARLESVKDDTHSDSSKSFDDALEMNQNRGLGSVLDGLRSAGMLVSHNPTKAHTSTIRSKSSQQGGDDEDDEDLIRKQVMDEIDDMFEIEKQGDFASEIPRNEEDGSSLVEPFNFPSRHAAMVYSKTLMPLKYEKDSEGYNLPDTGRRISLWRESELVETGPAPYLYLKVVKYLIVLFIINSILSLPALVENIVVSYVQTQDSSMTWAVRTSLGAFGEDPPTPVQAFMMIFTTLGICAFLLNLRLRIAKLQFSQEEKTISSTKYAVRVTNLHRSQRDRKALQEFFSQYGEVVDVTIGFNVGKIIKLYKAKTNAEEMLVEKRAREHCWRWTFRFLPLLAKLGAKAAGAKGQAKKLWKIERKLERVALQHYVTTGDAFITFQLQSSRNKCYRVHNPGFLKRVLALIACCCAEKKGWAPPQFQGRKMNVKSAPEPADVLWENLEVTLTQRIIRTIIFFTITTTVTGVCFIGLFYLTQEKVALSQEHNSIASARFYLIQTISISASLVITLTNWVLKKLIMLLSTYERPQTSSYLISSTIWKLVVAMLFNSVLMVFLVNNRPDQWYSSGGLVDQAVFVVLANALGPPWISAIQFPWYLRKWGTSWFCCSQEKLNKTLTMNRFNLSEKYAIIVKTVGIGLLYAPFLPLAYPITAIGLTLYYWTDKYQLLVLAKKPPEMSNAIILSVYNQIFLIFVAHVVITCVVVLRQTQKDPASPFTICNIISITTIIVITVVFIGSPMNRIFRVFLNKKQKAKAVVDRHYVDVCQSDDNPGGAIRYNLPVPKVASDHWSNVVYPPWKWYGRKYKSHQEKLEEHVDKVIGKNMKKIFMDSQFLSKKLSEQGPQGARMKWQSKIFPTGTEMWDNTKEIHQHKVQRKRELQDMEKQIKQEDTAEKLLHGPVRRTNIGQNLEVYIDDDAGTLQMLKPEIGQADSVDEGEEVDSEFPSDVVPSLKAPPKLLIGGNAGTFTYVGAVRGTSTVGSLSVRDLNSIKSLSSGDQHIDSVLTTIAHRNNNSKEEEGSPLGLMKVVMKGVIPFITRLTGKEAALPTVMRTSRRDLITAASELPQQERPVQPTPPPGPPPSFMDRRRSISERRQSLLTAAPVLTFSERRRIISEQSDHTVAERKSTLNRRPSIGSLQGGMRYFSVSPIQRQNTAERAFPGPLPETLKIPENAQSMCQ